ncbi:MAG: hypothetical protein EB075_01645 [Bacteroidetes bacterium]|nr:hypothetical protein [Bacteroidota bacterium]
MTMMPPRTKIDGLNGGPAFQGAPAHSNLTARELIAGPAAAQFNQSFQQTVGREQVRAEAQDSQRTAESAAQKAAELAANAKLGALVALHKQHPLEALPKIAANLGIPNNTGYGLG